ncbi:MAG TPA: acyl-CoA thioester hydrolase/BAAT C-terminal domain-containing protein [Gemmatimonadaceae bacterium]|nr:acyl-CoA thioester hydrolase/BAAT C-terminal domain-containing protein [Gemmatimonadaceae bacterium]
MTFLKPSALLSLFLLVRTLDAQTARFELNADTLLVHEQMHVAVVGLNPREEITIRADGNHGVWHSSTSLRADEHGRASVRDPMKLIWSATGDQPAVPVPSYLQPWVLTAEHDGKVLAIDTVWRRALPANVRIVRVRERGLVGTAYFPPGSGPHPAMIVLAGSQGGIPAPAAYSGGLASLGYVVLGLAYFNAEGLPPLLQNIPLEYFAKAVDWLKSQPGVDSTRIGIMGGSRGGEAALLVASIYPQLFRVVIASVPSNVIWPGLSDDTEAYAWTLNGKPLPSMRNDYQPSYSQIQGADRFRRRLQAQSSLEAAAEIPVERITAPILLFSAKDDQIWPSAMFASRIVERLKKHHFTQPVEHYSYENAGHLITRPYVPTTDVQKRREHPVSHRWNVSGGTPEGQAHANEDSWERLQVFLGKYLSH